MRFRTIGLISTLALGLLAGPYRRQPIFYREVRDLFSVRINQRAQRHGTSPSSELHSSRK